MRNYNREERGSWVVELRSWSFRKLPVGVLDKRVSRALQQRELRTRDQYMWMCMFV